MPLQRLPNERNVTIASEMMEMHENVGAALKPTGANPSQRKSTVAAIVNGYGAMTLDGDENEVRYIRICI